MTAVDPRSVERAVAHAAVSVPGVAGLQPGLGRSLADAAHAAHAAHAAQGQHAPGTVAPAPGAGVRARYARDSGVWHVEVRCVLTEGRRALETARAVRARARAAVHEQAVHADTSRYGTDGGAHAATGDCVVAVTITRIVRDT
ncbi:hypothetical protein ABVB69_11080 [Streptomyces sp. NPDC000349]|uniref:hypothetical protein n=1 Tax=unclassified Streptomyces TaxID=2593676 RepID=UPI0027892EB2|nr:hypothetical protein [Streptomyces sp. DSM 40167]MDQ0405156.1 hypothetical protein [Streptomyces sp. DSM 40167]